ncbi:hypothetical protein MTO96_030488 [Rhipicephalus appendiculatus]
MQLLDSAFATGHGIRPKSRSFLRLWAARESYEGAAEAEGNRPRKFQQVFGSPSVEGDPAPWEKKTRKSWFVCDLCPYTTGHKTHMRDHMRTHSGEKPFKCTKCPAAFTQAANCRRHLRSHWRQKAPST